MAGEIGRIKSGKLLKITRDEDNNYLLEIGGEVEKKFSDQSKAEKEARLIMLQSWLPEAAEENIREMLNSYLSVEYNFMVEWCERQAREDPDCDCGCWGYPMEIGTYWTWGKKKFMGCPKCGEEI